MSRPWPPGAATGIGSLPGDDPDEAARLVFGELPELPHLVELPGRGPGADLLGRSAAVLLDLPVEIVPSGWRLTARAGRDARRARDFLSYDLDALEAQAGGHAGALKVQVAGPWTLAAGLELPSGHRVISDHGATRELAQSLAAGITEQLGDIGRRIPGAELVLQLDEPSLPAVIGGRVPTPSGFGTVRAVQAAVAGQALRDLFDALPAGVRIVHCCAPDVPIALLQASGVDGVSVDATVLGTAQHDALGEAVDAGLSLWLGVLPSTDAPISFDSARKSIRRLWSDLGFAEDELGAAVVPTPTCGLAGATPDYARRALAILRDLGHDLVDPVERRDEDH